MFQLRRGSSGTSKCGVVESEVENLGGVPLLVPISFSKYIFPTKQRSNECYHYALDLRVVTPSLSI